MLNKLLTHESNPDMSECVLETHFSLTCIARGHTNNSKQQVILLFSKSIPNLAHMTNRFTLRIEWSSEKNVSFTLCRK